MILQEAEWLSNVLATFSARDLSPLVYVGSSYREYREVIQPHIERLICAPLSEKGVEGIYFDMKDADGVDICGDIFDDRDIELLRKLGPRAAICANMMEHVLDPQELASRCLGLLPDGGHLFVTVPHSYPYHRDPFDTMFRPDPCELSDMFAPSTVVASAIVVGGSYLDEVKKRPWIILRHVVRFPFPFLDLDRWKRSMRKLYWLFNPYLVSCVVIRKETGQFGDR